MMILIAAFGVNDAIGLGPVAVIGNLSPSYGAVSFCGILVLSTEHVVGPLLVTDHVVGVVACGVFRWVVRPDAGRHGGHRPVDIAVAEKGESVPLAARAVDRAVRGGQEIVIGPALQ